MNSTIITESRQESIQELWHIAITLRINILINNGGITKSNWQKHRKFIEDFNERCLNEPSFTEAMLFRIDKKPGLSAEAFNMATKAVAILAFVPGGVEWMGVRYDASRPTTHSDCR